MEEDFLPDGTREAGAPGAKAGGGLFSSIDVEGSIDEVEMEDVLKALEAKGIARDDARSSTALEELDQLKRARRKELIGELKVLYEERDWPGRGTSERRGEIERELAALQKEYGEKRAAWDGNEKARDAHRRSGGRTERSDSQLTIDELKASIEKLLPELKDLEAKLRSKEGEAGKIGLLKRLSGEGKSAYQGLRKEIEALETQARQLQYRIDNKEREIAFKQRMHGPDNRELSEEKFRASLPGDPSSQPVITEDPRYKALMLEREKIGEQEGVKSRQLQETIQEKEDKLYDLMRWYFGYEESENWGSHTDVRKDFVESGLYDE